MFLTQPYISSVENQQAAFFAKLREILTDSFRTPDDNDNTIQRPKICPEVCPDTTSLNDLEQLGCQVIIIYNDEREHNDINFSTVSSADKLDGNVWLQSNRLEVHDGRGLLLTRYECDI